MQRYKQTGREADKKACRETNRQALRWTRRQAGIETIDMREFMDFSLAWLTWLALVA